MSLAAVLRAYAARITTPAFGRGQLLCTCASRGGGGGGRKRRSGGSQRKRSSTGGGGSGGGGSTSILPLPLPYAVHFPPAAEAVLMPYASLKDRRVLVEKLVQTAKDIKWGDLPAERPQEATKQQIDELQHRLGYRFKNLYLLRLALVHSSAAPTTHNGIMAWIGDAAMYVILSEEVAGALGYMPIGVLSEVRKTLIGRAMCERYASHLGLGQHLVVGKSVRVQSEGKASINMVAEMFEAVMGAIYLDSDLEAVRRCYLSHFPLPADPLSLLQADGTGGMPSGNGSLSSAGSSSPWEQ